MKIIKRFCYSIIASVVGTVLSQLSWAVGVHDIRLIFINLLR